MKIAEKTLTAAERKKLPGSSFALPGRRFPIEDKPHARAALSRAAHKGGDTEKRVRAAVHSKFPSIGEGSVQERAHVIVERLIAEPAAS